MSHFKDGSNRRAALWTKYFTLNPSQKVGLFRPLQALILTSQRHEPEPQKVDRCPGGGHPSWSGLLYDKLRPSQWAGPHDEPGLADTSRFCRPSRELRRSLSINRGVWPAKLEHLYQTGLGRHIGRACSYFIRGHDSRTSNALRNRIHNRRT